MKLIAPPPVQVTNTLLSPTALTELLPVLVGTIRGNP